MCVDGKTPSDTDEEFSFLQGKWYRNLRKPIQWWHHVLSHGGVALHFPVESDSCGLIPGVSTPLAFILTPASSWRFSWRLAPSPPADQEQVAGQSKPQPISEWCSLWDWGGEGRFRSIAQEVKRQPTWDLSAKCLLHPSRRTWVRKPLLSLSYVTSSLFWDLLLSPWAGLHLLCQEEEKAFIK